MPFLPSIETPPDPFTRSPFWFLFHEDKVLINTAGGEANIPQGADVLDMHMRPEAPLFLGWFNDTPCYAAELTDKQLKNRKLQFQNLRRLYGTLEDEMWGLAGFALQLVTWHSDTRYCSRCAHPVRDKSNERAKICDGCGLIVYPRINPCTIVAVLKKNKILLARSSRFPKHVLYSVIAGYVEPGETLEVCIKREVKEEVNIDVKNIKYFGSQPWPFSSSLMVAFTAEYAGGTIKTDDEGIIDAGWYAVDELPSVPGWGSIAGKLIDWFIKEVANRERAMSSSNNA